MSKNPRLSSLDGLRGIAAFVVLLHHSLLLVPAMLVPYRDPIPTQIGDRMWWLVYTPLHLLWDGGAAVTIFFVLSGFVLCLPIAQGKGANWAAYYPQRLLRLYVPVWFAVLFAAIVILLLPHADLGSVSGWVSGHPPALNASGIVNDLLLVWNPGFTNSALWTLKWEVLFSLLLPLYILFGARWARGWALKLTLLAFLLLAGALIGPADRQYQMGALYQLPVFAVGAILAFRWNEIQLRLNGLRGAPTAGLWAFAIVGMSSYWIAYAPGAYEGQIYVVALSRVAQVAGAAVFLLLSARDGRWSNFLNSQIILWLGTRSFSLYLVHEPLVVIAGNIAGRTGLPLGLMIPLVLVLALVAAEIFFRAIERPSHKLARAASDLIRRNQDRKQAVLAAPWKR